MCCKDSSKDDKNAIDYANGGKKPVKADPAMKELLTLAAANEEKIVKIQAAFRGNQQRRQMAGENNDSKTSNRVKGGIVGQGGASSRNYSGQPKDGPATAKQLNEMPDYSN